MEKLDLTKKYKSYYTATRSPALILIEAAIFLSIEGKGDPNEQGFADNTAALYATAYAIKFACKALEKDFTVPKLEALWWFDETKFAMLSMSDAPTKIPRSEWQYRLLIRLPYFVTQAQVDNAKATVIHKKKLDRAAAVEYFQLNEGRCVQMLHVGPFDTEPETLKIMQEYMEQEKLSQNGYHHEIYLSDFRKTPPAKLRTILREPVR